MHVYGITSGLILGFAGPRGLDSPVHVYGAVLIRRCTCTVLHPGSYLVSRALADVMLEELSILGFAGPRGCDVGGAQKSTTKQG